VLSLYSLRSRAEVAPGPVVKTTFIHFSNENLYFSHENLHFSNENLHFGIENLNFINATQQHMHFMIENQYVNYVCSPVLLS
jgi:hypothetical protein